jgi:hypothetical protein
MTRDIDIVSPELEAKIGFILNITRFLGNTGEKFAYIRGSENDAQAIFP